MKLLIMFGSIALLVFASVGMIALGANTEQTYLPWVIKPVDYPVNGWVITDLWVINGETYAQLQNNGWIVNGKCIDRSYPAPPIGTPCQLISNVFYCTGSSQRFILIELILTPTPTPTNTPTITPTPTELPTETLEPTLHPPTGVTSTPTMVYP